MEAVLDCVLWLLVLVLPLAWAGVLACSGWSAALVRLAPWCAAPALVWALLAGEEVTLELPWLLAGTWLGVDAIGRVFLAFTALLWLLAGLFGVGYLAEDPRRGPFFALYLVAMTGNLGVVVAQDLVSFYLFFAVMSFASYGLVIHHRDAQAMWAGRIYITLVVLGEAAVFTGLVCIAYASEGVEIAGLANRLAGTEILDLIILLVLVGFGVKAGALPVHVWLPLAHPAAPAPASALLSGAMIKAGLLGWLRFLPLGEVTAPTWGSLCLLFGLAAALYAVLVGLTQDNPKTVLAYSSISQMGLMTVPVGLGLAVPGIWPAALSCVLLWTVHHGLAKGALFLAAGLVQHPPRAFWPRAAVAAGLVWPALALAGLPLTGGAVAKTALKEVQAAGAPLAPEAVLAVLSVLDSLLPWTSVGTMLLLSRFLWLVWPLLFADNSVDDSASELPSTPLLVPWGLTVATVVLMPLLMLAFTFGEPVIKSLAADKFWDGVWPVGLGVLLAWIAARSHPAWTPRFRPRIPTGDLLIPAVWLIGQVRRFGSRLDMTGIIRWLDNPVEIWHSGDQRRMGTALIQVETWIGRWFVTSVLFLVLALSLLVLLTVRD